MPKVSAVGWKVAEDTKEEAQDKLTEKFKLSQEETGLS